MVSLGVPLVQGYLLARPAPPWTGIEFELAHRLTARQVAAEKTVLRDVVEPAPAVLSMSQALEVFTEDPGLGSAVLIDADLRPISLLTPDAAAFGVVSQGMRANLDTPLGVALDRSMTRETTDRFEPLLVTDNAGRFAGIARMERMITAVTATET